MLQVIEQTRDEKIAMYMRCTKRELAEMLLNCNEALSARNQVEPINPIQITTVQCPSFSWTG